jgi:hypothetical protein
MAVRVKCPGCQGIFTLGDEVCGKQVRCTQCSQVFQVGSAPAAQPPAPPAPPPAPPPKPAVARKPPSPASVRTAQRVPPPARPAAPKTPPPAVKQAPATPPKKRGFPLGCVLGGCAVLLLFVGGVAAVGVVGAYYYLATVPSTSKVVAVQGPAQVKAPAAPEARPDQPAPAERPAQPEKLPVEPPAPEAKPDVKPEAKPEEKPAPPAPELKLAEVAGDAGIKPPGLPQDRVVRQLPSAVGDVCVGGGGRYLVLHLPRERKLAVFDANEGKVVRYLSLAEDNAKIAAGMAKLLVAYPDKGVLARYDLRTGEREVTAPVPGQGGVAGLCMGSASDGPLLVIQGGGQPGGGSNAVFLDPATLKPLEVKFPPNTRLPSFVPQLTRAAPDGLVFTSRDGVGGEPHSVRCVVLSRDQATVHETWMAPSILVPGPDGQHLYTAAGVYNYQLKPVLPKDQNPQGGMMGTPYLPAEQGGLFLQLQPPGDGNPVPIPGREAKGPGSVAFFLPGDETPFAKLDGVEGVAVEGVSYGTARDPLGHDKRVHYIPAANLLVTIPATNDRLLLYRFDLDKELAKADRDYLFVASQPPRRVDKGATYRYKLDVKSKQGAVKFQLASGPDGMKVSDAGVVTWKVPDDWGEPETDVIVNVSDKSGREAFHTFKLHVPGAAGGEKVAARPAEPKDVPPEPPGAKPGPDGAKVQAMEQEQVVKQLPAPVGDVAVGGGGRYLVLSLPKLRKLAVFDALTKALQYVSVGEAEPKLAAGADKLLVLLPESGVLQRYDLKTLQREVSVPLPVKGQITAFAMGAASPGPLLVGVGAGALFLDVRTLKALPVQWNEPAGISATEGPRVRASADGRTFGVWRADVGPSGLRVITLAGNRAKQHYEHIDVGHVIPGPDGKVVYTARGRYTGEVKPLEAMPLQGGYDLPAVQGRYYLQVTPNDTGVPGPVQPTTVTVNLEGDARPLLTLKDVELGKVNQWDREVFNADKRVHFLPAFKLLVTIPDSNDRLVLRRLDLEEALEKSGIDYLLVTSEPPASVKAGDALEYQVTVKAKKGGVKYKLESGPKGMAVARDGKLTWKVPADYGDKDVDVILSVGDATGQEVFHTFRFSVTGSAVAEAPGGGDKPAASGWKEYTHKEGGFAARLPVEPKNTAKDSPEGKTGGMEATTADGVRYEVQFNDLPKGGLAAGSKFFLDAIVKQFGDNVKSQKEVKLGDDAGVELVVAMGDLAITMRIFIVKERMYQLMVTAPKDKGNAVQAAEFLDSFKLGAGGADAPKKELELVAAGDLTKAYADDEAAANKRYGGRKAILVEGVVKDTHVDKDGAVSLLLKGHDDGHGVVCNAFGAKDNKLLAETVKQGQTIRVKGWASGKAGEDVLVGNCQFVQ